MSIIIELEVDDKGTATVKRFSDSAGKDLDNITKKSGLLNKKLGGSFEQLGKTAIRTTTAIAKFALQLGTVSIVAGAGAIALITKEASLLEQKMDFLGAVLKDKTEANFASLNDTVLQLGATTEFMSTQVAEAGEQLAKAGFSTQEIIGALPGTLDLATAGTLGLADAASITSNTLRAFGIEASETSKVSDVLAKTAISTNTTVQTIGESMKFIAPLARTAGISLQETSAALGLLGNVGITASMAGTTLRAALSSLLTPTREQNELMKQLGLNVLDSQGNIISLTEVIRQLQNAGATTADMLALFGRRGGPGMAALLSEGADALANFTTELENAGGTAGDVADEKLDNFRGQLTILRSATQNFMIALGDPLLPQFSDLIKFEVIPTVQAMGEFVKNNKDQVAAFGQGLVNFFRITGEAISSFVSFMQSTGLPIISTVFKGIGDVVGFVTASIVTFIDWLSFLGEAFNKLPESMQTTLNVLAPMTNLFEFAAESSTGLRDNIESVGVKSIEMGNSLAGLTEKVSDFTFGIQQAAESSDKYKTTEEEVIESTSTLAKMNDGQLIPSLMDTQAAFEDSKLKASELATEEIALAETTINVSDTMNTGIDSVADSWNNVTSSINSASGSLTEFSNKQIQAGGLGEFGVSEGQFQAEVKTEDLRNFINFLATSGRTTVAAGPAAGIPIPMFQQGGIVPGNPNEMVPAILHGGETVIPSGGQLIQVQLMLNDEVLAEKIIDINEKNVSGFQTKFNPIPNNIKNFQDMGV
jgi:TP901 family phage tail tape measure protein